MVVNGERLMLPQIYKKYQIKILICAVQRGAEVIIPNGEFELKQGDRLHITASHEEMARFFRTVYPDKKRKVKTGLHTTFRLRCRKSACR